MRAAISAILIAVMMAFAVVPAAAQQPIRGQEAVAIVQGGQIRASSSQGFQGFLLLVENRGKNYVCVVTATGQVQTCNPLYW